MFMARAGVWPPALLPPKAASSSRGGYFLLVLAMKASMILADSGTFFL